VPVIDRGVFHNYVHCASSFLCDVIRSCDNLSTPSSQVPHLLIRDWKRKKTNKDKRKDHGTVDEPSSE